MGYTASACKAGNLIRAKNFISYARMRRNSWGRPNFNPYSVFVCLFVFSFQKQLPVKRKRLSNTSYEF